MQKFPRLDIAVTTPGLNIRKTILDYTDEDLQDWNKEGPGTTFQKYYPEYYDLVVRHGLDPGKKPEKLDITETRQWLGYEPHYSLKNLLVELDRFGEAGPPAPAF